jgi:competence protein ComEC
MLTLGESLRSLFRGRLPEILSGGLSASLGAFVITSPVVAYCFGSLRPIGLIAGLIIAPVSSLFMIFALAALAAGFLPLPFRVLPDFILTQLYRLIKFLVSAAGSVPGLPVSSPAAVLAFVIVFWLLILFAQRKDRLYRNSIASFD